MINKCVDMKQGTKHPLKQQRYKMDHPVFCFKT